MSGHLPGAVNGLNPIAAACVLVEMLKALPLSPFLAAVILVACAKSDPVADNAVAPSEELLGDASASGLSAPANAAAAEAARQASLPPATGGLAWTIDAPNRTAVFGPQGTPAFSIQCQKQREGPNQLIFIRYMTPNAASSATLSFTGNGQAASVPISAVRNPSGLGGEWRAVVYPGDTARDVAETFNGPGTVDVSISGLPSLVVPAGAEPRRVLSECLAG
jgi:hypothetical protein